MARTYIDKDALIANIEDDIRRRSTILVLEYARSLDAYNQYSKADIDKNIAWLEKQGILADKIKPKFKVGDWVVYKNDICQIVKREEGCNKLVTVFGIEKELVNERNLSTARLWTIKNAKDGDILAYPDGSITLFRNRVENLYMAHILWVDGHIELNNSCAVLNANPATEEQRNFLFEKMKEAGYEWNAKKKELRMIEKQLLVNKFALIKEIKKRIKENEEHWKSHGGIETATGRGVSMGYRDILYFLDTLKVEKVDLEKEYKEFINCDNGRSMLETAKHFFELGLKAAQKGK